MFQNKFSVVVTISRGISIFKTHHMFKRDRFSKELYQFMILPAFIAVFMFLSAYSLKYILMDFVSM